jgi:outer membrane protein assembly factor BamD
MAGHYFRSFAKTFPFSKNAEEAEYLSAFCYYKDSPPFSLDQSYTMKAIEEMQVFINKHPNSTRLDEANKIIDKLRHKLEEKSYSSASLYFQIGDYKAAITALKNSLIDYPDSEYREDIMFLILKSSFLLADKSVFSKKHDRFVNTQKAYVAFEQAYPESEQIKEVIRIRKKTEDYLSGKNI